MKILKIVVIFALCITAFHGSFAYSAEEKNESKQSVYANKAEQDEIHEAIQNQEMIEQALWLKQIGVEVLVESSSPVYTVDMLEYARTGEFRIEPLIIRGVNGTEERNNYAAKLITSDGQFAGTQFFCINDGKIKYQQFIPSPVLVSIMDPIEPEKWLCSASCSYADQARRIQTLLQKDDLVSVYDVKYVRIDGNMDGFFYVNDGTDEVLISVGELNINGSLNASGLDSQRFEIITPDELKKVADVQLERYNAHMEAVELWEKEHPGEEYNLIGENVSAQSISSVIVNEEDIDNILDIAGYLHMDMTAAPPASSNSTNSTNARLYVALGVSGGLVVIAAVAIPSAVRARKRRRMGG